MKLFNGIIIPEKPKTSKDKLDMVWAALFNEVPHKFRWVNVQLAFMFGLIGVVIALNGLVLSLVLKIID